MKVIDLIKLIKADGWYLVRQKGSHQQFRHPVKKGWLQFQGISFQMK
jgi:predicted RNA binding protein YcfA (HicA-like mRNA interferase family)